MRYSKTAFVKDHQRALGSSVMCQPSCLSDIFSRLISTSCKWVVHAVISLYYCTLEPLHYHHLIIYPPCASRPHIDTHTSALIKGSQGYGLLLTHLSSGLLWISLLPPDWEICIIKGQPQTVIRIFWVEMIFSHWSIEVLLITVQPNRWKTSF